MGIDNNRPAGVEETDPQVTNLLALINLDTKQEVKRYCRTLEVRSGAFADLIFAARQGALAPVYEYACRFRQTTPTHLDPRQEEMEAFDRNAKVGQPFEGLSKKFARKIFQSFEERRLFAAHLFYSPCWRWWHIFYFDQRDRATYGNHWQYGPHIHYTNDIVAPLPLPAVWTRVNSGETGFLKGLHLRFVDDRGTIRR